MPFAPIVVKRGQRFRYENVTISLASSCDSNVVHSALFNLEWTSKCSLVAIDTDRSTSALFLSERAFFGALKCVRILLLFFFFKNKVLYIALMRLIWFCLFCYNFVLLALV